MIVTSKKAQKHILKIKEHHSKMLADMEFMKRKKEQTKITKQQEIDKERARRQAIGEQIRARNEKNLASKAAQDKETREQQMKERELALKEKAFNEE